MSDDTTGRDGVFVNPWSDTDVSDRQPQYCPYCGYNGAFDGHGHRTVGGRIGYIVRCPECGHDFMTLDPRDGENE